MQTADFQVIILLIFTTLLIVLLLGLVITIFYLYQNKRIAFSEHVANIQLEIQEETFQNISREIHDNIGLSLTLAKLHLNTLNLNTTNISERITSTVDLISQAINDLSHISKNLNSESIRNEGFLNVLNMELEKINKLKKFNVDFKIKGQPVFVNAQNELILYRIAQEALNNIIKHSKATIIHIELDYTHTFLALTIKDNGIGINWQELEKTQSSKMMAGLNNMKKRAKMINGICNIKSSYSGTTVFVTLPLENK